MHETSYLKAKAFVSTYLDPAKGERLSVLEVGAKSHGGTAGYRPLFPDDRFDYTGLDLEAGTNVDIVPKDGFVWRELDECRFDVCISGQTFEHNPFFWITFAEIARILKPGGMALIIAPGAGSIHRYPWDCWRFYPDAWDSLCALTGMELVESYFEPDGHLYRVPGAGWRDSAVIARKPRLAEGPLERFHDRLSAIGAIGSGLRIESNGKRPLKGIWAAAYEDEINGKYPPTWRTVLRKFLRGKGMKLGA